MHSEYLKSLRVADAIEIAQAALEWEVAYRCEHPEQGFLSPAELRKPPLDEKVKLDNLITKLTTDELSELTALAWLGRKADDERLEDWPRLVKDARVLQEDTTYLCSKLPLGRYLMDGLKEIRAFPV